MKRHMPWTKWVHASPVELALAILGTRWDSPEEFERSVRVYALTHFGESLVVGRRDIVRFAAWFKGRAISHAATATDAIARAFIRRWVRYRLDDGPLADETSKARAAA